MLQDLEKGKKCEIDAINGVVVSWGKKMKIPTPVNDKVVELVMEAEEKKEVPSFKNLDRFILPALP